MLRPISLFALSLLIFHYAEATQPPIKGVCLDKSENERSVCLLTLAGQSSWLDGGSCTATLVTPTTLVTAKHCFMDDNNRVITKLSKVRCGYQTGNINVSKLEFNSLKFDVKIKHRGTRSSSMTLKTDSSAGRMTFDEREDIALIELKKNYKISEISPMELLPNVTQVKNKFFEKDPFESNKYRFLKNVKCRLAGYGIDNDGNSKRLCSTELTQDFRNKGYFAYQVGESKDKVEQAVIMIQHILNSGPIEEGDSGGPLYCRTNDKEKWILIGIASSTLSLKDDVKHDAFSTWDIISTKTYEEIMSSPEKVTVN